MPVPSTYTAERGSAVVCRLSSGRSLQSVARDPDLPSITTIRRWARRFPDFAARLEAVRVRSAAAGGRRRVQYSPALAAGICAALAEGFTLREICASADVPVTPHAVLAWTRTRPQFAAAYAEATRPRQTPDGLRIGQGRRRGYTPERARAVIDRLLQGRALADIGRDPDMPSASVIAGWRRPHLDFHRAYQAARRFQLDLLFDEILAAEAVGDRAPAARRIARGVMARGALPMGAGRVDEAVGVATPPPVVKVRKRRREGAPGIGHNWRGR